MVSSILTVAVVAPIALNVALWRRFTQHRKRDGPETMRSEAVMLGLFANTLAVALPWLMVLDGLMITSGVLGSGLREVFPMMEPTSIMGITIALSVVSLVAGIIGPRPFRMLLICSGVLSGCWWFLVPVAVL